MNNVENNKKRLSKFVDNELSNDNSIERLGKVVGSVVEQGKEYLNRKNREKREKRAKDFEDRSL